MTEQISNSLLETWSIHNRIHLYLLEAVPDADLSARLPEVGRNVHALFAHIHNVRLMWLKAAGPDLLSGVEKLDAKPQANREQIKAAFVSSGDAIYELISRSLADGGKVKGFKPHAAGFLGYLISHESHHRGQIEWALRFAGRPLPDNISYGLWEWGVR